MMGGKMPEFGLGYGSKAGNEALPRYGSATPK